jgi:hypothetical protein
MRRVVMTLAATLVPVAIAGCGLDPYASRPATRATTTARAPAPGNVRARAGPTVIAAGAVVRAPAPGDGSSAAVLYRFAHTYGNVSSGSVVRQQRALLSLASGAFAVALRAGERIAQEEAVRALPAGARLQSTVASLQLAPRVGAEQRGVVILEQHLLSARGAGGVPVMIVFLAAMLKTAGGWRVTTFTAEH